MKKLLLLITLILLTQSSFTQSKFTLSVFGGYSLPLADMKEDFPDNISGGSINFVTAKTYLLKNGFNGGISFRWLVDTASQLRVTGSIALNRFTQKKDYNVTTLGERNISNSMNILTFAAGVQYDITPKKKVNPYVGLELTGNLFSGTIETSGDTLFTLDRKSDSRFGVNVNAGLEYKLSKKTGLIFGAKYCFANLLGKSKDTQTTSSTTDEPSNTFQLTGEIGLNDTDPTTAKSKSINFAQFYLGLSFYFGKR